MRSFKLHSSRMVDFATSMGKHVRETRKFKSENKEDIRIRRDEQKQLIARILAKEIK